MLAERGAKARSVRRLLESHDNGRAVGVCHFEGREERRARLLVRGGSPPIPVAPTRRSLVEAVVVVGIRVVLAEGRRILLVAERGHGAYTGRLEVGAAESHRTRVRWTPRVRGIVATGAGHAPGRRERRIEEERPAKRGKSGRARLAFEPGRVKRVLGC